MGLIGDATKARRALGWEARARWLELTRIVVAADVEAYAPLSRPDARRRESAPACGVSHDGGAGSHVGDGPYLVRFHPSWGLGGLPSA